MSDKLKIDLDSLTIGDMEDFEDIVGIPMDKAMSPQVVLMPNGEPERDEKGRPVKEMRLGPTVLKALVYIIKRAENPEYTLADARNVRITMLDLGGADDSADAEKNDDSA